MNEAQKIIMRIHNEIGVSDSDIAYALDISREHINRVKNGKIIASDELTNDLNLLLEDMKEINYKPYRKHYDRKKSLQAKHKKVNNPIEENDNPFDNIINSINKFYKTGTYEPF